MHKALYSTAERIYDAPVGADPDVDPAAEVDGKKPLKQSVVALRWLAKNAPLHTSEWAAWAPRIRSPRLGGKWLISANMPGKGRFVGTMTVTPKSPGSDEFTTQTTLRSLEDGSVHTRTGSSLVYTGFSWRGSSQSGIAAATPNSLDSTLRETMWVSPDQSMALGRWYWGEYNEFGYDVTMRRDAGAPVIGAISAQALKAGTKGAEVHIYGANFPTSISASDISFGADVSVKSVKAVSPTELVVTLDAASDAKPGARDLLVQSAVLEKALPVYGSIDYLKVTPETALAHLGGIKYAKGYEQFTVEGYSSGLDGKAGTEDDFAVMPVDATWSMQEFHTVTYDNDVKYVGTIDPASGLFTPNVEGPNPERRFGRNNYGETWVVATAKSLKDKRGKPLSARSYLVTTVPTYKRWDQPEVSQ